MAITNKNIVITPAYNIADPAVPKIVFSGADASTANQDITLNVYPQNQGTLSFEGINGQIFSINNAVTGTIFSVNDVSGIPSIEVLDTGTIKLGQYSGNVLIGAAADDGKKLQVTGTSSFTGDSLYKVNARTCYGPNTSWSGCLIVGGDGVNGISRTATIASVVTTNGNLHLDSGTSGGMHLNYYSGSGGILIGNGASAITSCLGTGGNICSASCLATAGMVCAGTCVMATTYICATNCIIAAGTLCGGNVYTGGCVHASSCIMTDAHICAGTSIQAAGIVYGVGMCSCGNICLTGQLMGCATCSCYSTYAGCTCGTAICASSTPCLVSFRQPDSTVNTDTKGASGISYFSGGTGNIYADGALYQQAYAGANTTWGAQIMQDYRTGKLAVRGLCSTAWTTWLCVIDSSTIGAQTVCCACLACCSTQAELATCAVSACCASCSNQAGCTCGGATYAYCTCGNAYSATAAEQLGDQLSKTIYWSAGAGGSTFTASHYSMGRDLSNSSWTLPYPDLIIGYHTGIRFGAHKDYQGIRFYDNSPTSDTNNDGHGDGGESLLMSVGCCGSDVIVSCTLYAANICATSYLYGKLCGCSCTGYCSCCALYALCSVPGVNFNVDCCVITPGEVCAGGMICSADCLHAPYICATSCFYGPYYNASGYFYGCLIYGYATAGTSICACSNIVALANITAYSDCRVKENIHVIDCAMCKVEKLRGVTFTRTDREDKEKRYAGVIAQEVLAVLPEVIETDQFGMYSVAYGNLVGLLIEAIKEQQVEIKNLQKCYI